jgi:hypothetical protein
VPDADDGSFQKKNCGEGYQLGSLPKTGNQIHDEIGHRIEPGTENSTLPLSFPEKSKDCRFDADGQREIKTVNLR